MGEASTKDVVEVVVEVQGHRWSIGVDIANPPSNQAYAAFINLVGRNAGKKVTEQLHELFKVSHPDLAMFDQCKTGTGVSASDLEFD